ncbi:unnamed protein product, partial [Adineta steineri]
HHLANALQHNKTLTTLNLYYNKIKALGAQHLANALQHNKTLTTLNLGRNEISASGARHLAAMLRNNKVNIISSTSISSTLFRIDT